MDNISRKCFIPTDWAGIPLFDPPINTFLMEKMETELRANDIAPVFDHFILRIFNSYYGNRVCTVRTFLGSRGWKNDAHKTLFKIEKKLTRT